MKLTDQHLLAELERRERAEKTLTGFCEAHLDVIPAAHHILICEAIDDLLADKYDELIINTPPGAAKSTYTSIGLPSYFLSRWPKKMVLAASYSTELAEKWGRRVRNIVGSREFEAQSDTRLSADSRSAGRWATEQGGEFYAAGVGSGILGFRADLAVIDDPISGFEEAQSLTQLQKVHGWYETDFVTRLKPGAKTVLICQRLARNDLAGYLIDRNIAMPTRRQRVLILKMECEEGDQDPLGRAPGDRLWPEWFNESMVQDAKRDDFKWRTLYQQQPPSDDGSWVSTEDIQFRPRPVVTEKSVLYGMTDLALSVNTGDYTVNLVVAIDDKGDWDIVHGTRERVDPEQSSKRVVELAGMYRCQEWLIDDDNASKVFMPLVATKARSERVNVPWKPMPMRGIDKETRAAPLRGQFKRRKIYMPADAPFTKWLVKELLTFPNATGSGVDDGIDALGLLGRRMIALAKAVAPVVQLRRPTIQEMTLEALFEDMPKQTSSRI